MPNYGHRFDTEQNAEWFVEYCESFSWLAKHIVRQRGIVGVDDELAAEMHESCDAFGFVRMASTFDAGATMALRAAESKLHEYDHYQKVATLATAELGQVRREKQQMAAWIAELKTELEAACAGKAIALAHAAKLESILKEQRDAYETGDGTSFIG